MEKASINFLIKSLDTSNNFTCEGEIKNNRIKFIDNENNTNYIIFHKDIIEYYKKGNVDMKYKFDKLNTTKGEYTFSGYNFVFVIVTKEIIKRDNYLEIQFELYQNNDLVNQTKIVIEHTFLKEE